MNLQMKRLREDVGLSQGEMAERLGIKRCTYGTWERGERAITLTQAERVADVLGCTLDDLAGREMPSEGLSGQQGILLSRFNRCTPRRRDRLLEDALDYARISGGERDDVSEAV